MPAAGAPGVPLGTTPDGEQIIGGDPSEGISSPSSTGPAPAGCGDGVLTDDEACDDGNRNDGDGCAANCLAPERGFSCAVPGMACLPIAVCGDGVVAGSEQCDDNNLVDGGLDAFGRRIYNGRFVNGQEYGCGLGPGAGPQSYSQTTRPARENP